MVQHVPDDMIADPADASVSSTKKSIILPDGVVGEPTFAAIHGIIFADLGGATAGNDVPVNDARLKNAIFEPVFEPVWEISETTHGPTLMNNCPVLPLPFDAFWSGPSPTSKLMDSTQSNGAPRPPSCDPLSSKFQTDPTARLDNPSIPLGLLPTQPFDQQQTPN